MSQHPTRSLPPAGGGQHPYAHWINLGFWLLIIGGLLWTSFYTVSADSVGVVQRFGKFLRTDEPGLRFKAPFGVDEVTLVPIRRQLKLEFGFSTPGAGNPYQGSTEPEMEKAMVTGDLNEALVEWIVQYRINDPTQFSQFFTRLRDERSALSRLEDIIGSELRNAIAKHDLIEIVRTDKNRKASADAAPADDAGQINRLLPITLGRTAIEKEIVEKSAPKLKDFGIELIDVRFMRVNYNPGVSAKIHERMMSERQQIASRFRSEGEGEAAKILGSKERDLRQIESESYRQVQVIKGEADARASEIYARAYGGSAEAAEFHQFLRTMESYRKTLDKDTTLLLSTDSDLFRYLKQSSNRPASKP